MVLLTQFPNAAVKHSSIGRLCQLPSGLDSISNASSVLCENALSQFLNEPQLKL